MPLFRVVNDLYKYLAETGSVKLSMRQGLLSNILLWNGFAKSYLQP